MATKFNSRKFISGSKGRNTMSGKSSKNNKRTRQGDTRLLLLGGGWETNYGVKFYLDKDHATELTSALTHLTENDIPVAFFVFPNDRKQTKNSPDFRLYLRVDNGYGGDNDE